MDLAFDLKLKPEQVEKIRHTTWIKLECNQTLNVTVVTLKLEINPCDSSQIITRASVKVFCNSLKYLKVNLSQTQSQSSVDLQSHLIWFKSGSCI